MSRALVDLLSKEKIITPQQAKEALERTKPGESFLGYILDKGYTNENKALYFFSQYFSLSSINLQKFEIRPEVVKLVSADLVRKLKAIPIQAKADTLVVAIYDPTIVASLEPLRVATKMNIEAVLTSHSSFYAAISKYYGGGTTVTAAVENYKKELKADTSVELVQVHDIDSKSAEVDAPVIQIVNSMLAEGIRLGASDIHVEPYEHRFRVRLRIDGVLSELTDMPSSMRRPVIARLKIMSRMDIAETRVPQDGRIKLKASGKEIDFRVNSMPTIWGEKVVLRVLSKSNLQLDMMKLGFEQEQLDIFRKGISSANGMVLVTGPTGSGKTTTLYSALSELNQVTDNLATAEDPVEYNLEGINQAQVQKEVGMTFAAILRALLRQDPDVILVGEIRDYETAEVAIQAAMTGHLVLSTLHTNDAISTITRLINMGVEPFLVTAALNVVIAQRLLRKICVECKEEDHSVREAEATKLGIRPEQYRKARFLRGKGCQVCKGTGYKGRVAIYETFEFTQEFKEMVLRGETVGQIKKAAYEGGMRSLRQSGILKAMTGVTTLSEAISGTMET